MNDELLFNKFSIFSVIESQKDAIKKKVDALPANTVLGASESDLLSALFDELALSVPSINEEDIHIASSAEEGVDVSQDRMRSVYDRSRPVYLPGNKTVIAVPFSGDSGFFHAQPQTYSLNPPRATIGKGELLLTYVTLDTNAAAISQAYKGAVAAINTCLRSLSESAKMFNDSLPNLLSFHLKARKDRLLASAGMTAALGLPLKKREGIATSYTVPVSRRAPKIERLATVGPFKPEPTLADDDYSQILSIMTSMVQVMELSPHAFLNMGEEDIRSHFLVQLNGAYQGQATGETFNFQGKTDILIRVDGRNIFIAECKFWKGEKSFLETIDQLLSYLSWRDTKAAGLIFNRNSNFSSVLEKIREAAPKHTLFKRELGRSGDTVFRYVFAQPTDPNREVRLTVLVFDIPTGADTSNKSS